MPRLIDEEKKEGLQKGEMLRQAAVVVFLLLGVLFKNAGIGLGAAVCPETYASSLHKFDAYITSYFNTSLIWKSK